MPQSRERTIRLNILDRPPAGLPQFTEVITPTNRLRKLAESRPFTFPIRSSKVTGKQEQGNKNITLFAVIIQHTLFSTLLLHRGTV